jgi:hypothetical protein
MMSSGPRPVVGRPTKLRDWTAWTGSGPAKHDFAGPQWMSIFQQLAKGKLAWTRWTGIFWVSGIRAGARPRMAPIKSDFAGPSGPSTFGLTNLRILLRIRWTRSLRHCWSNSGPHLVLGKGARPKTRGNLPKSLDTRRQPRTRAASGAAARRQPSREAGDEDLTGRPVLADQVGWGPPVEPARPPSQRLLSRAPVHRQLPCAIAHRICLS